MHLKPEDVKVWFVDETEPVKKQLAIVFKRPNDGKALEGLFLRLKEMLQTYPPNERFFSFPQMDINSLTFWVKSQNNKIRIRATYFVWAETCVIDKFSIAD